jgi:rubrerythrin
MKFNNTVLATQIENVHRIENMMYKYYSDLLKDLNNVEVKEKLKFIRDQELDHVKMVTDIISILLEYISKE